MNPIRYIDFEDGIPAVVHSLPVNEARKTWNPVIIICAESDHEACSTLLKAAKEENEQFMKTHDPHICEANKRAEEEYKRKLK